MSCSESVWPWIANSNSVASFALSFVSLFPQIIETYKDKTVAGLSPVFLLAWVCGDITSLIGAVLTNQLTFQVLLALYFLVNDLLVCGQYYYYGILHDNQLATVGHEFKTPIQSANRDGEQEIHDQHTLESRSTSSFWQKFLSSSLFFGGSSGLPLVSLQRKNSSAYEELPLTPPESPIGVTLSWIGASFYVGARIPQLIKNYQRKSTDGISPLLFGTTLLCNLTYNVSILTSCDFINSQDKAAFLWNAAPFIAGTAGTIIFDLLYFYQHYVLYADDLHYREREEEREEREERVPLLE